MGSKILIGIILGAVLGVILLLVGFIGKIVNKHKRRTSPWPDWVMIAGGFVILTAIFNAMKL